MAIIIKTSNPNGLLDQIGTEVHKGISSAWSIDAYGHFVNDPPNQWRGDAWLRPQTGIDELRFDIVNARGLEPVSKGVYGVYHGRFIEMVLTHFDNDFSTAIATAQITEPDDF